MKGIQKRPEKWLTALNFVPAMATFGLLFLWWIIRDASKGESYWVLNVFALTFLWCAFGILLGNVVQLRQETGILRTKMGEPDTSTSNREMGATRKDEPCPVDLGKIRRHVRNYLLFIGLAVISINLLAFLVPAAPLLVIIAFGASTILAAFAVWAATISSAFIYPASENLGRILERLRLLEEEVEHGEKERGSDLHT